MSEKEVILTLGGLNKLEAELNQLKTIKRREIAERIKQAIEFGDISENSEYEDAKNDQAFVEGRILTLEKMLRRARVIDEADIATDVVSLGSRVLLKDIEEGLELEFVIVGTAEADPRSGKISVESPVGRAILGQANGQVVEVKVPAGKLQYQILDICR
jgi:transcription elongation factor GreA